ncbi:hypothetical protein ACFW04_012564 [Cataglyphis niger]
MCHAKENWIEILPTVLLGLRICFKEDLNASPAKMLYGSTLRIAGEFFIEEDLPSDPEIFIEKHRIHMREIKSRSTAHHHKKLLSFIKIYTIVLTFELEMILRKSLQPPYSGPFRVVERINDYLFTIDISGKIVNSTTERLKPAFLPKEIDTNLAFTTPLTSSDPFTSTSSGKQLKTYSGPKKKIKFAT